MLKQNHYIGILASICSLLLLLPPAYGLSLSADSARLRVYVGANLYGGVLYPHKKEMELFRERYVKALELRLRLRDFGLKPWNTFYRFPEYGISYLFMDLGSPTYLGYAHGLIPYVNIPLNPHTHRIAIGSYWGAGLGYITKRYHRTENFKNQAISTPINAAVSLGFTANIRLTEQLNAHWSFNLIHFSNGTHRKPNAGLNFFVSSLGASFLINEGEVPVQAKYPLNERGGRLLLVGSYSNKEELWVGGAKFNVGAMSLEYTYRLLQFMRFGATFDSMYDTSREEQFLIKGMTTHPRDILQLGGTLHLEVVLHRLSAGFYLGRYFHDVGNFWGANYHRLGLRYRISDSIWAHLMLKTHLWVADYVEYGIAMKLF